MPLLILLLASSLLPSLHSLRSLQEASPLTVDEVLHPPPSSSSSFLSSFTIPPNPEAPLPTVKAIPLPVFDPSIKFEYPPNANTARVIDMPPGSFFIEFTPEKRLPVWDPSVPIKLNSSLDSNSTLFSCATCVTILKGIKEDLQKRGSAAVLKEWQNACEKQKSRVECAVTDTRKMERIQKEDVVKLCVEVKYCKDEGEVSTSMQLLQKEGEKQKEEDERREKWLRENENKRRIIEAQELLWRKQFKREHNETTAMKEPLLFNVHPQAEEGSGEGTVASAEDNDVEGSAVETTVQPAGSVPAEESVKPQWTVDREEEEEVKARFQAAILEAKKAQEEEVGFIKKTGTEEASTASWLNGPRVELPELTTTTGAPVEEKAQLKWAPVQCNPHGNNKFVSSGAERTEEGPAHMDSMQQRDALPQRLAVPPKFAVNGFVNTQMEVSDIA